MNHTTREMRTRLTEQKRLDQIAKRAKKKYYDALMGIEPISDRNQNHTNWLRSELLRRKYAKTTRRLGEQLPAGGQRWQGLAGPAYKKDPAEPFTHKDVKAMKSKWPV